MLELLRSQERGISHLDWLYSKHTFSFSHYYNPKQIGFSDLLVINDDIVENSKGFGTHPHSDMEIFSYVLDGALEHKDSMGTGSVIYPGDVQMMSAGTGITHSEFNHKANEKVHFLQIWIIPNQKGVKPRYQQVHFDDAEKRGQLRLIISPEGENGSLSVYQDVRVYSGLFDGEEKQEFTLSENRYAYIHIAKGEIVINGITFKPGDGARVRNESKLTFSQGKKAEVLLFDLRPNELPELRR